MRRRARRHRLRCCASIDSLTNPRDASPGSSAVQAETEQVMDLVVAPLFSAVLLTISAVGLTNGTGKAAETISGILGNLAAAGLEAGSQKLLERISDESIDRVTGLPRNHHIQRASADALRGAVIALLLETASRIDPRKPWIDALAQFVREGRFGREPLIRAFERPDLSSVNALRTAIDNDAFVRWHDKLRLTDSEIRSCFEGGACSLRNVLPERFAAWVRASLRSEDVPPCLFDLLREGWGSGGTMTRFEDIYCLYFREFLTRRPEVFRIFLAETTTSAAEIVIRIEERLHNHVSMATHLLEGSQTLLAQVREGQRELAGSFEDVVVLFGVFRSEQRAGNEKAQTAIDDLFAYARKMEAAFRGLELRLFGLPLVRPAAAPPPRSGDDDLWIIRAKHRALELVGRDEIMASLWDWLHGPAAVSVRLLVGPAGAGKTRLGYELIWRVAAEYGDAWHAGRIEGAMLRRLADRANPTNWEWDRPTLVMVDYARAATDGLQALLKELARRTDQQGLQKIRVLLLERVQSATADWIGDLKRIESDDGGRAIEELFDPPNAVRLPTLDQVEMRRSLMAAALRVLAVSDTVLELPPVAVSPAFDAMLAKSEWAEPLVPVMAALVAHRARDVMRATSLSRTDLADMLSQQEQRRVLNFAALNRNEAKANLLLHVAAMSVLCGGLSVQDAVQTVEREAAALHWSWPDGARDLVRLLNCAWTGDDAGVARLEPDLIAEAFVLGILVRDSLSSNEATESVLRVAEGHEPAVADLVLRAFHNFQGDHRRAEALAQWTAALVEHGLTSRQPALIAALDDAMPVATVALRKYAQRVTQARYDAMPILNWDDLGVAAERARLAHNLANRHAQIGERERAAVLAEESVNICRELASRNPSAFLPKMAVSLDGLADRYTDLGRLGEALALAQEAMPIHRELAACNSETFRPNLARSLSSFGMLLAELGRLDEALLSAEEATAIYRDLAAHSPARFRRELAASLGNLSNRYEELKRHDEALATAEGSTEIFRDLASQNDDAFKHELATALSNLSNRYARLGLYRLGLAPAQEATTICRQLVLRFPNAFRENLAACLNNLASRHDEINELSEALAAAEECAAVTRDLASQYPDAIRPKLAMVLNNLAMRYARLEHCEKALASAEESVAIRRELARKQPKVGLPVLALSLKTLASCYHVLGRVQEAIAAAEELKALPTSP